MDIASRMIERAEIEYALIVDGESSRPITEATVERLLDPDVGEEQFRAEFASLTLGSGAAAMILARKELAPHGHPYLGSVSRSATEFNKLCHGQMDRMVTDTRVLLSEGLKLASKTFQAAKIAFDWVSQRTGSICHPPGQQGAYRLAGQTARTRPGKSACDLPGDG